MRRRRRFNVGGVLVIRNPPTFSSFCSHLLCFFMWRSRSRRVMYVMPQFGTSQKGH